MKGRHDRRATADSTLAGANLMTGRGTTGWYASEEAEGNTQNIVTDTHEESLLMSLSNQAASLLSLSAQGNSDELP